MDIRGLLEIQRDELSILFQKLDCDAVQSLIDRIISSNGNMYFTGVGKSGGIATHTADMLKSLGYNAFYLSPINCLHGDLGTVNNNDLVFLYSKSGNTTELLNLAPYLMKVAGRVIGVFCNDSSKLSKFCHDVIVLPCGKELDFGFNLIPTTSILCYTVLCNLMVGYILRKTQMSLETYGKNHPSGSIGRSIWLTVSDIMIEPDKLCVVTPNTTLVNCMLRMSQVHTNCALIINNPENYQLVGILTDGDIRRYLTKNHFEHGGTVGHLCTPYPYSIRGSDDRICHLQLPEHLIQFPVVNENNRLLGLVMRHDM